MSKCPPEVREKAYDLFMIQQLPYEEAVRKMREEYPTFAKNNLTKWKNDPELNWEGRYKEYCKALAIKSDKERVKKIKPMVYCIEEIRDKLYDQLIAFLEKGDCLTVKNIGLVLTAFVRLGDLEYKMKGGRHSMTPVQQVINIIIMALEKNPNVGPVIKAHKHEIIDAVFEEIKGE